VSDDNTYINQMRTILCIDRFEKILLTNDSLKILILSISSYLSNANFYHVLSKHCHRAHVMMGNK